MFRKTADKTPLVLQAKPILRWANNTRLTEDGFTYLWIGQGRPEAVACIYSWGPDRIRHNFQSLSRGPLEAERDGRRVWNPAQAGVEFRSVPDAAKPTDLPAARLRQMKAIAEAFAATGRPASSTKRNCTCGSSRAKYIVTRARILRSSTVPCSRLSTARIRKCSCYSKPSAAATAFSGSMRWRGGRKVV